MPSVPLGPLCIVLFIKLLMIPVSAQFSDQPRHSSRLSSQLPVEGPPERMLLAPLPWEAAAHPWAVTQTHAHLFHTCLSTNICKCYREILVCFEEAGETCVHSGYLVFPPRRSGVASCCPYPMFLSREVPTGRLEVHWSRSWHIVGPHVFERALGITRKKDILIFGQHVCAGCLSESQVQASRLRLRDENELTAVTQQFVDKAVCYPLHTPRALRPTSCTRVPSPGSLARTARVAWTAAGRTACPRAMSSTRARRATSCPMRVSSAINRCEELAVEQGLTPLPPIHRVFAAPER